MTFLMMILLVLANLTNVMAEFAGIASSLELFHISRYISVPLAAVAVWFLVVKGNYRSVEKIFLFACVIYVTYIISGFLVKPDWKEAAIYSVKPVLMLDSGYIYMLIGMVGTTIAPWMQFYLQSAVVEKGVTRQGVRGVAHRSDRRLHHDRRDRVLHHRGVRRRHLQRGIPATFRMPTRPRMALKPFGQYAFLLFSAGLFNASIFAACILPLSTAYSVCEGLGFEAGVNRRIREAPIFYFLYTLLIVVGARRGPDPGLPAGPDDSAVAGA